MNDLILLKLEEIVTLQDIVKTDDLNYKSKCVKSYNFVNIHYLLFSRDIHEGNYQ